MASNRKKLDEKHLKILRNLVSLPGNKQCFDCNQRGPTYVNVTIGSFVCTTCSGFLRGLTPPHRVKSISMAAFTPEEIEMLQSRGNEYCRKVWLALHDSNNAQNTKDEHLVRDFMVAKYEKKLYYVEPSAALKNGNSPFPSTPDNNKLQHSVPNSSLNTSPPTISSPLSSSARPHQTQPNAFVPSIPNFSLPDPFEPIGNHTPRQKNQIQQHQSPPVPPQPQPQQQQQPPEQSFANFDNNPIFNSTTITSSSSFPSLKPASEDKYAALKDLDCLMKMQQESSQPQGIQANGWSPNNLEKSHSSNPFHTDIGNNNVVVNPFRSGLIQQPEKNSNNNSNYGNGNAAISSYSNSSSSNNTSSSNPWGSGSPWTSTALPSSQSMPFPPTNWNGKGNFSMIPGNSNNPFL